MTYAVGLSAFKARHVSPRMVSILRKRRNAAMDVDRPTPWAPLWCLATALQYLTRTMAIACVLCLGTPLRCSSTTAPALSYYRPSMDICIALLPSIHGYMHFPHLPRSCGSYAENRRQRFQYIFLFCHSTICGLSCNQIIFQ